MQYIYRTLGLTQYGCSYMKYRQLVVSITNNHYDSVIQQKTNTKIYAGSTFYLFMNENQKGGNLLLYIFYLFRNISKFIICEKKKFFRSRD